MAKFKYLESVTNQNFIGSVLMGSLSMENACLHSVLILLSSSDQYNINIVIQNYNLHCEITGSHRVDYEDRCSLGCDTSSL